MLSTEMVPLVAPVLGLMVVVGYLAVWGWSFGNDWFQMSGFGILPAGMMSRGMGKCWMKALE